MFVIYFLYVFLDILAMRYGLKNNFFPYQSLPSLSLSLLPTSLTHLFFCSLFPYPSQPSYPFLCSLLPYPFLPSLTHPFLWVQLPSSFLSYLIPPFSRSLLLYSSSVPSHSLYSIIPMTQKPIPCTYA